MKNKIFTKTPSLIMGIYKLEEIMIKILDTNKTEFSTDEILVNGSSMLQVKMINGVDYTVEGKVEDAAC